MRLEGSLDAFSLPDIFSLLSMTKKTGGLHLRREGAHGVVWFTTGAITGGAADVSRQPLARRVVGAGLIDDETLKSAVARAGTDELGIVRALQQSGLDEGALHDVTSEHIVDTVFDLLRWPDGGFVFVVDEENPDEVGVSRQVDDVVTEARRRLDVWSSVAATIPSPQSVLSLATNPPDDPQLTRDDWSLLALVDGRRAVGEIVALLGRGDFAVVSALADLVNRGLLSTDASDVVADLVRRHAMLASLETAPAVVEEPTATSVEPVVTAGDEDADEADEDAEDADDDFDADEVEEVAIEPAPTKPLTRVPDVPVQGDRAEITPQRPEPFLPPREVEHPEPLAVAAVGGAAAVPAPSIERDPSVNKSLLLRLIAGVRGL